MLGLVQFAVLQHIRTYPKCTLKDLQEALMPPLKIKHTNQISVTVTRLIDRGIVKRFGIDQFQAVPQGADYEAEVKETAEAIEYIFKTYIV